MHGPVRYGETEGGYLHPVEAPTGDFTEVGQRENWHMVCDEALRAKFILLDYTQQVCRRFHKLVRGSLTVTTYTERFHDLATHSGI